MKVRKKVLFLILFVLLAEIVAAQDSPKITSRIGGTIQTWASYGQINATDTNSLGVGIKRARLRAYSKYGNKVKGFIQVEVSSPRIIDARIEYLVSKSFSIRAGRFVGASVRAGALTSHTKLDITERSFSAIKFAKATVGGDFRDYGIDFVGKFGGLKANITLHNGSGSLDIKNSQKASGIMNGGAAISGMLVYKPKTVKGLEIGGYYGKGNPQINDYEGQNAYVYWSGKPIRIKMEYIAWKNRLNSTETSSRGYYIFAGYKIAKSLEAVARFESFDPNTDLEKNEQSFLTIGATYSIFPRKWNAAKITAAYMFKNESGIELDNNVFQLVMQVVF